MSALTSPGLTSSLLLEGIWSSVASIRESFRRDTGEQRGTKLRVAKGRWGRGVYIAQPVRKKGFSDVVRTSTGHGSVFLDEV